MWIASSLSLPLTKLVLLLLVEQLEFASFAFLSKKRDLKTFEACLEGGEWRLDPATLGEGRRIITAATRRPQYPRI